MHYWIGGRISRIVCQMLPLLMLLWSCGYADAATSKKQGAAPRLDLKIEGSRTLITVGTGLGITAEIKNASETDTIYLYEKNLTLAVPPELQGPQNADITTTTWAEFPTEEHWSKDNSFRYVTIAIKPGESYTAFWYRNPTTDSGPTSSSGNEDKSTKQTTSVLSYIWNKLTTETYYLFFTPGDYKITISGKYWTRPPKPEDLSSMSEALLGHDEYYDYHTTVASTLLHVAAPETVILIGATIGGLIAYIVFPNAQAKIPSEASWKGIIWRHSYALIGAVLLSAIVTILLSRISESQFLIRVTVSDVWGAIAIGFVANYLGSAIITKILGQQQQPAGSGQAAGSEQATSSGQTASSGVT